MFYFYSSYVFFFLQFFLFLKLINFLTTTLVTKFGWHLCATKYFMPIYLSHLFVFLGQSLKTVSIKEKSNNEAKLSKYGFVHMSLVRNTKCVEFIFTFCLGTFYLV